MIYNGGIFNVNNLKRYRGFLLYVIIDLVVNFMRRGRVNGYTHSLRSKKYI